MALSGQGLHGLHALDLGGTSLRREEPALERAWQWKGDKFWQL